MRVREDVAGLEELRRGGRRGKRRTARSQRQRAATGYPDRLRLHLRIVARLQLAPGSSHSSSPHRVINYQQQNRSDHRRDKPCTRVRRIPSHRPAKEGGDDRAGYADADRDQESTRVSSGCQQFCYGAHNQANEKCPNEMQANSPGCSQATEGPPTVDSEPPNPPGVPCCLCDTPRLRQKEDRGDPRPRLRSRVWAGAWGSSRNSQKTLRNSRGLRR